jgi:WD40 repeat protein
MVMHLFITLAISSLLGADGAGQCLIGEYSGHRALVYGLCSLPSGEGEGEGEGVRFLSGSDDNTILEWRVGEPSFVGEYIGHTNAVNCVESLGGNRFMSGDGNNKVMVWEVGKYSPIKIISNLHTDDVKALLDLKDGSALSASWDKTIVRFNVATGQKMMTYTGHTNWVNCLALLPDGSFLSGSSDDTIRRWSVSSSTSIETYSFPTNVYSIKVLSPSFFLAGGGGSTTASLKKFKIGTPSAVFTFNQVHSKQINSISLLPDLSFVTGGADGLLLRWVDGTKDPVTYYTNPGNAIVWSIASLTDGSLVTGLSNTKISRHKTNGTVVSPLFFPSLVSLPFPSLPLLTALPPLTDYVNPHNIPYPFYPLSYNRVLGLLG